MDLAGVEPATSGLSGAPCQSRTDVTGFAALRLASRQTVRRAEDGTRTRRSQIGNLAPAPPDFRELVPPDGVEPPRPGS